MEQQLLIINTDSVRRRIKREIELLIKEKICIEDDVGIKDKSDAFHSNIKDYEVEFKNLNDNKYYKFIISNNYPFKPPKLHINNKPISYYHRVENFEFKKKIKKYTGIECFCCETILCANNWSPNLTFNKVMKEFDHYRDINRQIVVRLIVDIIKRKYLIDDINIIEWLY